jgi:acyl carrier protein
VKLRGYRVELDEVAAVLAQHAAVQECVLLLREDRPAERQLVAYVVPGVVGAVREPPLQGVSEQPTDTDAAVLIPDPRSLIPDLRTYLAARLPEYMLPAAFVLLERLPLTINRKVDRKALPAPELDRRALERAFEPPQTPLEQQLAAIWSEVLHAERVGRSDNFFELGGHSLLATQVISRVRQHVGLDLPLRTLFELPTVAGMAERIEALQLAGRHLATLAGTPIDDEEEGEL